MAMSDEPPSTGLPAPIEGGLSAVPAGWKAKASVFLLRVVGFGFFPKKAHQIASRIRDAKAQDTFEIELARQAAVAAGHQPWIMDRAIQRHLGNAAREQENLENIALRAAEEIAELDLTDDIIVKDEVGDDWLHKFSQFAGAVSDEEMQKVWAKLLAGEFRKPGTFSFRTLRLVSELDDSIAKDFAEAARHQFGNIAFYAAPQTWNEGALFELALRLEDCGLTSNTPGVVSRTMLKDPRGRIFVHGARSYAMLYWPLAPEKLQIPIIQLSSTGQELLRLIERNDERAVIKRIVQDLRPEPREPGEVAVVGRRVDLPNNQIVMEEPEFLWGDQAALDNIPPEVPGSVFTPNMNQPWGYKPA